MARFMRLETLNKIKEIGVIPVFYHGEFEVAKGIVMACAEGGAKVIEFTNRGDFADEVYGQLEKFVKKEIPDVILGVGSIIDPYTAALYISSGANFLVGPVLNVDVAKLCNSRKLPYSPGCGTVTEIATAHELGCEIVKVFPGEEIGGPGFIKSVRGPMPWATLMPTGGVSSSKESLSAWFEAGAACVGMGSNLITKELVARRDFAGIRKNVENCIRLIKDIRKQYLS